MRVPSVMDGRRWPASSTIMMWACIKTFRKDQPPAHQTTTATSFDASSLCAPSNPFDSPTIETSSNPFDHPPDSSQDAQRVLASGNALGSEAEVLRPWNGVHLFNLKSDDEKPLNISGAFSVPHVYSSSVLIIFIPERRMDLSGQVGHAYRQ